MFKGLITILMGPSKRSVVFSNLAALSAKGGQAAIALQATLAETGAAESERLIIDFEREGDKIEDEIRTIVDRHFDVGLDKNEVLNLASQLDSILDGSRKVAIHMRRHRTHLVFDEQVKGLMGIICDMAQIITHLCHDPKVARKMVFSEIKQKADELEDLESKADALCEAGKDWLASEGIEMNPNVYRAQEKLYDMLEEITDSMNHCGTLLSHMARKEA